MGGNLFQRLLRRGAMGIIVLHDQDNIGETTDMQESHSPLFVKQFRKQHDQ
jgi:hypothetical protein